MVVWPGTVPMQLRSCEKMGCILQKEPIKQIEWMEKWELIRFVAFIARQMVVMPSIETEETDGGPCLWEKIKF